MRTLLFCILASASFAGQADINIQGTESRKFISMWTPDGYVDMEIRKYPVTQIRIENEHGRVILDTYMTKSSKEALLKALE
jgi:hypothetical protein